MSSGGDGDFLSVLPDKPMFTGEGKTEQPLHIFENLMKGIGGLVSQMDLSGLSIIKCMSVPANILGTKISSILGGKGGGGGGH